MAKSRFVTGEGAFVESSVILTVIQMAKTLERTVAVFANRIAWAYGKNVFLSRGKSVVPEVVKFWIAIGPPKPLSDRRCEIEFAGVAG